MTLVQLLTFLQINIYIYHSTFSCFSKVQGEQTQCSVLLKQKQILAYLNTADLHFFYQIENI